MAGVTKIHDFVYFSIFLVQVELFLKKELWKFEKLEIKIFPIWHQRKKIVNVCKQSSKAELGINSTQFLPLIVNLMKTLIKCNLFWYSRWFFGSHTSAEGVPSEPPPLPPITLDVFTKTVSCKSVNNYCYINQAESTAFRMIIDIV